MEPLTLVEPFCEGKIRGIPEYYNSISALYILYTGYVGLLRYKNQFVHSDVRTVYWFLFLNGIASFFCHWTSTYLWRIVDQFTMIFALWYGMSFVIKAIYIKNNFVKSKYINIPVDSTDYIFAKRRNKLISIITKKNQLLGSNILILVHLYNITMIIVSIFEKKPRLFALMFGIEATGLIYFFFEIYHTIGIKYHNGRRINVLLGIASALTSAFIWIITEILCNKYLIYGHAIWHLGISFGVNNLIMYINAYYNEKKSIV